MIETRQNVKTQEDSRQKLTIQIIYDNEDLITEEGLDKFASEVENLREKLSEVVTSLIKHRNLLKEKPKSINEIINEQFPNN